MITRTILAFLALAVPASAQPIGTGSGLKWTPYDIHSGMSYFYGMAVGDFGLGRNEVAYADSLALSRNMMRNDYALVYLENSAARRMVYQEDMGFHPHPYPNPHMLVERMVVIDVNGDGLNDIVGAANSHDSVIAYINGGGGAWTHQVLTMSTPGAVNLALADADGDGLTDILVTMRNQTTVYPAAKPGVGWIKNMGSGSWLYADIQVNAGMNEPRGLIPIDIFPGGGMEFVVTDMMSGAARAYHKNGTGWAIYNIAGVNAIGSYYNAEIDVVGDSSPDLVYGSSDGIYAANITYNLTTPAVTKLSALSVSGQLKVSEIAVGDLDKDGAKEIVFSLVNDGVYFLRKSGSSWALKTITPGPDNYHGLALMDYDNDGWLDVLANIEYQRNALQVWRNGGPG